MSKFKERYHFAMTSINLALAEVFLLFAELAYDINPKFKIINKLCNVTERFQSKAVNHMNYKSIKAFNIYD